MYLLRVYNHGKRSLYFSLDSIWQAYFLAGIISYFYCDENSNSFQPFHGCIITVRIPDFGKGRPLLWQKKKEKRKRKKNRSVTDMRAWSLRVIILFAGISYFKRHYAKDNLVKKFSSYLFVYILYLGWLAAVPCGNLLGCRKIIPLLNGSH